MTKRFKIELQGPSLERPASYIIKVIAKAKHAQLSKVTFEGTK